MHEGSIAYFAIVALGLCVLAITLMETWIHLEVKTALNLVADLLTFKSKDESPKLQKRMFEARQTAIDALKTAREAEHNIHRAWVVVIYMYPGNKMPISMFSTTL